MQQGVVVGTGESLAENRVKLTWKRHVLPPLLGLVMMVTVLGAFNSQFIAAKISALTYKPPVATQQTTEPAPAAVAGPPIDSTRLAIGPAGVDAPTIYGLNTIDEGAFQQALQRGVVHYPGTALPGESGNVVIFGHSSGQVWAPGDYKFVFAHLEEQLQENHMIELDYKGVRYVYRVTGKKVVPPTDVSVLAQTPDNQLTLITCTPIGTDLNRLIVTAEQITPSPKAQKITKEKPSTEAKALPGNETASFWESVTSLF